MQKEVVQIVRPRSVVYCIIQFQNLLRILKIDFLLGSFTYILREINVNP